MNAAIVCSYLALGISVGVAVYACIVSQLINRRIEKMRLDLRSYDEKRLQNEDYIHQREDYIHQRIDGVARKVHDTEKRLNNHDHILDITVKTIDLKEQS